MRLLLFAVLCLISGIRARTDFSAWKDSVRVYFNTSSSGAALASPVKDFPLLIRLDSANFKLAQAAPGGGDIRFTDPDGTELPCHVARWDTGFYRTAEVWVNVPQVDPASTADYVVMYWGNPNATLAGEAKTKQGGSDVFLGGDNAVASKVVFDTAFGFVGVWHLDENAAGIGSQGAHRDASSAGNHGDDSTSSPSGTGVVGRAQQFDAAKDYIAVRNSPSLQMQGPMSFLAWIKASKYAGVGAGANLSQVNAIVRKGDVNPNAYQFCVSAGHLSLSIASNDDSGVTAPSQLETGKWIHVGGVWDGKNVQLYINGVQQIDQAPRKPPSVSKDGRPLYIGGRPSSPADLSSLDLFAGSLDEVQVCKVARGKAWYKLAYENQRPGSTLLTFKTVAAKAPLDSATGEDLGQWAYSRRMIVNTGVAVAKPGQTITDFPLLVRLKKTDFDFNQAMPMGEDIRFADASGKVLPYSQERWNTSKGADLWVKIPKLNAAGADDHVTMYWGRAASTVIHAGGDVFDTANGFAGVWHLKEGDGGASNPGVFMDATWNLNAGDDHAAAAPVDAVIGVGQPFGGGGDYISVPSSRSLIPTNEFTISAWIKAKSFYQTKGESNVIVRKGDFGPNNYQFYLRKGRLALALDELDSTGVGDVTLLETGKWYHVAVTWGKGVVKFYVNGAMTSETASRVESISGDNRPMYIGGRTAFAGDSLDQFDGVLDEVEFQRVERSADWISMAYQNQRTDSRLVTWEGQSNPDTARDTSVVKGTPASDTVLAPGQSLVHHGYYKVSNPPEASRSVRVTFTPAVDRGSLGIAEAGETITLLSGTGGPMPAVGLETNANLAPGIAFFMLMPGQNGMGMVRSLGAGLGSWVLTEPGEYFLGRDTASPALRFLEEGVTAEDSSWITMMPEDNVANLDLIVDAWGVLADRSALSAGVLAVSPGTPIRLAFKGTDPEASLKVTLRLRDGSQEAAFPANGADGYSLQRFLHAAKAPVLLKGKLAWNFVGIPLRLHAPLRMKDGVGSGRENFGAVWENDSSKAAGGAYRLLQGEDTLPTGMGVWLTGRRALDTLSLGEALTSAPGAFGAYRMPLVRGWNQVTSPALEKIAWPITSKDTVAHDKSAVKWLQGINPVTGGYQESDTLEPWRGYFVHADKDTVLELGVASPLAAGENAAVGKAGAAGKTGSALEAASAAAAAAANNAVEEPMQVVLEPVIEGAMAGSNAVGAMASLRLGAARFAKDGIGVEDEAMPPSASQGATLASVRGGRGWRTDLLGFQGASEFTWKLAWSQGADKGTALARLRVASLRLPKGTTLWAISPLRKLAAPAQVGDELEVMSDAADTLVLWAAPAGHSYHGSQGFGPKPTLRTALWVDGAAGGSLRLALPNATGVRADCLDANGRRMASLRRPAIAAGYYDIPLSGWETEPGRFARGLMFVVVRFTDASDPGRLVLKSIRP